MGEGIAWAAGQPVPGSHHSREFLHTFGGPKVWGNKRQVGHLSLVAANIAPKACSSK
jgi:hypothetical protein